MINWEIVFSVWFAIGCIWVLGFFIGVISSFSKGKYK